MDVTGAGLHNIETKWLYDFLTPEKCSPGFLRPPLSGNASNPLLAGGFALPKYAVGVELFNRQVSPQLSEQGKIFSLVTFATRYSSWKVPDRTARRQRLYAA